jgi:GNAT superfamily N-acetyltransferase
MKSYKLEITEGCGEEASEAQVAVVDEGGGVCAEAALWWRETPQVEGVRVGAIGQFKADDAATAQVLLTAATDFLRQKGCKLAVGPLNGNTWRTHRLVVQSDGRGPFLLEPRHLQEHPSWWEGAGFSTLSRYSSSVMPLTGEEAISAAVKSRLLRSVTVRPLDPVHYDEELRRIYEVSLKSFSANFLYTPLEEAGFVASYQKVRERVDPDLVRIAERDGQACGFIFGIADLEAAARGEKPAVIVKTLAVDPAARCAGLGSLLVDELHRISQEKGYTEAIHALQHEGNTSLKITGRHHGTVFRRYALFAKRL